MSSNIIINKTNVVNQGNNRLIYKFPSTIEFNKGDQICLSHLNVFFSWFNITAKNLNNFFQYKWFDDNGDLTEIFDILIPDGYYSIESLNEFIMSIMVANNHYLINSNGDYGYFIEIITNETYYSVEFRLSSISTNMTVDGVVHDITTSSQLSIPGTWKPPLIGFQTPQIIIPSNSKFGELIGFNHGIIDIDTSLDIINKQYSIPNQKLPVLDPSSSFIICCNMISNIMAIPDNILNSFCVIPNTRFGDLISGVDNLVYCDIKPGHYDHIQLDIFDQNFERLQILDNNMLLILSIIKI